MSTAPDSITSLRAHKHTLQLPMPGPFYTQGAEPHVPDGSQRGLTVMLYDSGTPERQEAPPLVLVHSVNATASAFEMEPVFLRQARRRRVVALDLPGFGAADKPDIAYTPMLMREAIVATLDWVGPGPVDLMALSLGSEFAAEAALERPDQVRSLALISPTGMETRRIGEDYEGGRSREIVALRHLLRGSAVGERLYRLLTSRLSMRYFLARSWGDASFDCRLLEHGRLLAAQAGAAHAPLDFVSGALFTRGVVQRYRLLPLPLWVSRGRRGPFTDAGACPDRTGSHMTGGSHAVRRALFDTGAMPHFSMPGAFDDAYCRFLDGVGHDTRSRGGNRPPRAAIQSPGHSSAQHVTLPHYSTS